MRIEPEIGGTSIVLLGDFNPTIFTPKWFALHEILPKNAADSAEVQFVHPLGAAFTFDGIDVQITQDRFVVGTSQAPYVRVEDLVVRVFNEQPQHTLPKAFGINRYAHFLVGDEGEEDHIGRMLAPPEPWGALWQELWLDKMQSVMSSLTMTCGGPEGRPSGDRININVQPSNRIGHGRTGICVQVNDHYTTDDTAPGAVEDARSRLHEKFEMSLKHSDDIIDHIISLPGQLLQAGFARGGSLESGVDFDMETGMEDIDVDASEKIRLALLHEVAARIFSSKVNSYSFFKLTEDRPDFSSLPRFLDVPELPAEQPPTTTLHALQEWEGYVVEIGEKEFTARLIDITAGASYAQEEAVIPLMEISDRDVERMEIGSIFRWVIGYERHVSGTKKRVSQIVLRDLPAFTEADLRAGEAWAEETMRSFGS